MAYKLNITDFEWGSGYVPPIFQPSGNTDLEAISRAVAVPCAHCGRSLTPRITSNDYIGGYEIRFDCYDYEGRQIGECRRISGSILSYNDPLRALYEEISRMRPFASLADKERPAPMRPDPRWQRSDPDEDSLDFTREYLAMLRIEVERAARKLSPKPKPTPPKPAGDGKRKVLLE